MKTIYLPTIEALDQATPLSGFKYEVESLFVMCKCKIDRKSTMVSSRSNGNVLYRLIYCPKCAKNIECYLD